MRRLAYFFHKTQNKRDFAMGDVLQWFADLHLHTPNKSRLAERIAASKSFVKVPGAPEWRLHALDLDELQGEYPGVASQSEDVQSEATVLPVTLYENSRGFIESLAKQINAAYEYNIFDGCAVLMRRLVEVLLILAYEHHAIEGEICGTNGRYLALEKIIGNASQNAVLKLSPDTKITIELFRSVGNFSAHKIYYNCRRGDLKSILLQYRVAVEELLYKSGVRK